jgi:putative transposase
VKKKRFSVEQITSVLQQVQGGVPLGEVCRQVGISEQSFYRWKKIYWARRSESRPIAARKVDHLRA